MINNNHDGIKQTTTIIMNDTNTGMKDTSEKNNSYPSWDCDDGVCVLQWKPQKAERSK